MPQSWDILGRAASGAPIIRESPGHHRYARHSDTAVEYMHAYHVYHEEELESHQGNLEFFFDTEADLAALRDLATRIKRVDRNIENEKEEIRALETELARRRMERRIAAASKSGKDSPARNVAS